MVACLVTLIGISLLVFRGIPQNQIAVRVGDATYTETYVRQVAESISRAREGTSGPSSDDNARAVVAVLIQTRLVSWSWPTGGRWFPVPIDKGSMIWPGFSSDLFIKEDWNIMPKPYEPEFKERALRMLAEALPEHASVHAAVSKHVGGLLGPT